MGKAIPPAYSLNMVAGKYYASTISASLGIFTYFLLGMWRKATYKIFSMRTYFYTACGSIYNVTTADIWKEASVEEKKRRVDKRLRIIFYHLALCGWRNLLHTKLCLHTHPHTPPQTHKHTYHWSILPCRHQEWWMCIYISGLWWIKYESSVYTAFYLTWNIYTFFLL